VDNDVKSILNDLYRAINSRLESSSQIDEQVRKLEAMGFHLSLHLEATLLLTRNRPKAKGRKRSRRPIRKIQSGSLSLDDRDIQFLKSLKIALDEKEKKGAPSRAAKVSRKSTKTSRKTKKAGKRSADG